MEADFLLVMKFAACSLVLVLITPAYAQFGRSTGGGGFDSSAPSILGRSGPDAGMQGSESHPIRVFASFNGTYDTNMLGYVVDENGNLDPRPTLGANVGFGASGTKQWRKSYLGLDYLGDYSRYSPRTQFNGGNHQLSLALGTRIGQKLLISSQIGAGTTNRFLGGQALFQAQQLEFVTAPTQELFNTRSYFVGNSTGATYSFDRRRSVRFTGFASSVKRVAVNLVDMQSYGASGDYVHRLNRATSVGVSYTFSHYDYKKVFGESDVHMLGVHLSRKFGRAWEIDGSLTGMQQKTDGVRTFALDPVLAAILGRPTGTEVFSTNNLLYGYRLSIRRTLRRSTATLTGQRSVIPGNGYFVTSLSESIFASVGHSLSRDLYIRGSAGYGKMQSLGFSSGNFGGWSSGCSINYKITDTIGFNSTYDWRRYNLQQAIYARNGQRVSVGISYHPQGGPAGLF